MYKLSHDSPYVIVFQALQSNVQQLLQAINQCVGGISGNGAPEEHQEKMVDLSDQLCASFSSSANILTLCKVSQ